MHDNSRAQQDWNRLLDGDERGARTLWDLSSDLSLAGEEPSLDAAWQRLSNALPATTHVVESKQERRVPRTRRWSWVAAAAAAILLLLVVNTLSDSSLESETFVNDDTGMLPVTLMDASRVKLEPGAQLSFEVSEQGRRATLNGTAAFDVERDATRPFQLLGSGFELVVMGTEFTVSTGTESSILVTEGHVRVRGKREADWMDLYAGDEAMIVDQLAVKGSPAIGTPPPMVFQDVTLEELQSALKRSGMDQLVLPTRLMKCKLTADFTGSTVEEIAQALVVLYGAEARMRKERIELIGGRCR